MYAQSDWFNQIKVLHPIVVVYSNRSLVVTYRPIRVDPYRDAMRQWTLSIGYSSGCAIAICQFSVHRSSVTEAASLTLYYTNYLKKNLRKSLILPFTNGSAVDG